MRKRLSSSEFAALAQDLLARGACVRFRAAGSSMWPFVRPGDVLLVETCRAEGLARGDIALCRTAAGTLVAHRVRRGARGTADCALVLESDLRGGAERIPLSRVLGRVVAIERGRRLLPPNSLRNRLARSCWRSVRGALVPLLRSAARLRARRA